MRLNSPLLSLSQALSHAAYFALSDVRYFQRDFSVRLTAVERQALEAKSQEVGVDDADSVWPGQYTERRPSIDEVEVRGMFAQTWGSTALGFGGIGGAAMTPAYTLVLEGPARDLAVYFGGTFAYRIPEEISLLAPPSSPQVSRFWDDFSRQNMAKVADAIERYGAVKTAAVPGRTQADADSATKSIKKAKLQ